MNKQRIKFMRGLLRDLQTSDKVLLDGEVCLIASDINVGYDSLIIGDGTTVAKKLNLIPLNVSKGTIFLGVATTETIPGTPNQDCFYMAGEAGTYRGFGIIVEPGEIAFFKWQNLGWIKLSIKTPLVIDSELSLESENPVQNKVITRALKELEERVDEDFSETSENPIMNKTVTNRFNDFDWYNN